MAVQIKNPITIMGRGGASINVVQETGTSTTAVMSQKAVTDELNYKLDANNPNNVVDYSGDVVPSYSQVFQFLKPKTWNIQVDGVLTWVFNNWTYYYDSQTEHHYRIGIGDENWEQIEFQGLPEGMTGDLNNYIFYNTSNELFYAHSNVYLKLDSDGLTWNEVVWTGAPNNVQGNEVWTFDYGFYYDYSSKIFYKLDFNTFTFTQIPLIGLPEGEYPNPNSMFGTSYFSVNSKNFTGTPFIYFYDYETKTPTFYSFILDPDTQIYKWVPIYYKGKSPIGLIRGYFSPFGGLLIEDDNNDAFLVIQELNEEDKEILHFYPAYINIDNLEYYTESGKISSIMYIGQQYGDDISNIYWSNTWVENNLRQFSGFAPIQSQLINTPEQFKYNQLVFDEDAQGEYVAGNFKFDGANLTVNDKNVLTEENGIKKPATAPTSQSIVSIDTENNQQNLTLGTNLSIDNGVLNASGGSKLYLHQIYIRTGGTPDLQTHFSFISSNNNTLSTQILLGEELGRLGYKTQINGDYALSVGTTYATGFEYIVAVSGNDSGSTKGINIYDLKLDINNGFSISKRIFTNQTLFIVDDVVTEL